MTVFAGDTIVSLREAAKLLPGRPHISTLHRWRKIGCRGVKLQTIKVGGRYFVSHKAIQEFLAASSVDTAPALQNSRTPPADKASDEIGRHVDQMVFRSRAKRSAKEDRCSRESDRQRDANQ
jgi:hypothetical protein